MLPKTSSYGENVLTIVPHFKALTKLQAYKTKKNIDMATVVTQNLISFVKICVGVFKCRTTTNSGPLLWLPGERL